MGTQIKPIETIYKGYRFRSRLEARWAVFFNTLGIEWEYEKEGFQLSDGTWYLPDFWLPELECWLEVKPTWSKDAESLARRFRDNDGGAIILAAGLPNEKMMLYCWELSDSSGGSGEGVCRFQNFMIGGLHLVVWGLCSWQKELFTDSMFSNPLPYYKFGEQQVLDIKLTQLAIDNAKQARFEHGESP